MYLYNCVIFGLGVVAYAYDPRTQEAEAEWFWVRGAAQRDTVSKNKNNNEIILFLIFKNIIVLPFCITVLPFVYSIGPSQPVAQTC